MKKILLGITLFLTLFSFIDVNAMEGFWTDNYDLAKNFNIIKEEKRYRWYSEKLIDLGYSENLDVNDEIYVDLDDYETTYGEWNTYDGNLKDNLEFRKWYIYQNIEPLKFIELAEFDNAVNISEIEVYVDDEKIDYKLGCGTCSVDNQSLSSLKDGIISSDNYFQLYDRSQLAIILKDSYPLDKIKVIIHFANTYNTTKFNAYFTKEQYKHDHMISKEDIEIPEDKNIELKIDETWDFNIEYGDINRTLDEVKPSWYTKVSEKIESREVIKKYHQYKIEKNYVDGYYKESPSDNMKKDEKNYKTYYMYEIPEMNYEDLTLPNIQIPNSYPNISSNNFDLSSLMAQNYQMPNVDMQSLLKSNNNINLEDYYNVNNQEEEVIKTDKSKFKNNKVKTKDVSKNINFNGIKKFSIALLILIIILLLINRRFRKS